MKNPQTTETLLLDQIERIKLSKQSNDVIDFINDINEETKYYEHL